MESFLLGMNAKAYLADAPFAGNTPTDVTGAALTELSNIKDLTINLETGEADITTRANNGWRATAATLKDGSLEFEMLWKPGDSNFAAIRDAWLNSTEIGVVALTGANDDTGAEGPASNFTVTSFTRSEALEEAVTVSVTLKPSSQTQWYQVA